MDHARSMPRQAMGLAACVLTMLPAACGAQVDAHAMKVYETALATHKALTSFSAEMEVRDDDPTSCYTASVCYRKPDLANASIKNSLGTTTCVCNGKQILTRISYFGAVSREKLQPGHSPIVDVFMHSWPKDHGEMTGLGTLAAIFRGDKVLDASTPGLRSLQMGADGERDGVPVESIVFRCDDGVRSDTVTMEFGKRDHLIRCIGSEGTNRYGTHFTQAEIYRDVRANPALPASRFVLKPAKGEKIVYIAPPKDAPKAGSVPPAIGSTDLDGKPFSFAQYRGKVLLVDFWGDWCGPCKLTLPHLVTLRDEYGPKGLALVGVAVKSDVAGLNKVMREHDVTWRQIPDPEGNTLHGYGSDHVPFTVVIGRDGRVLACDLEGAALEQKIQEALKQPAP